MFLFVHMSAVSVTDMVIKGKVWLQHHFLCSVLSLQAEQLMKRIGVEGVKLTEYEMNIASHLVDPQTMKVTVVILSP